jgi:hypothetical protein
MNPVTRPSHRPAPAAVTIWLLGFVVTQFVCQVALLFEALGGLRVAFRTAAFAMSLAALAFVPGIARRHPSQPFVWVALAIVTLELFHPSTNTPLAGIAHITLYVAVAAPLMWVTRLSVGPGALARVVALLFGFHTLSAATGVLQSLYPGRFQPTVSTVIRDLGEYAEGLKVTLADGTEIWRPMGLTDQPGGAASAGLYAAMFGMGFVAVSRRWPVRLLGAAGIAIGLYCIYLAQVRAALVVAGVVTVVFMAALVRLRRGWDAIRLAAVLSIAVGVSFAAALAVGGGAVSGRLETLVEESPDSVYYRSRGRFLEETVNELLPEYPAGAGLGRWGMTRQYFGDPTNPRSQAIWAEIQWTAWVLDGGLPLALAYGIAVAVAVGATARMAARTPDPWLAGWAAVVAAYGAAVCAMTFSYVPFIGQAGMEFWFLNAAVWTAGRASLRQAPA